MCYSAQVWESYRNYLRKFGAEIDIREFIRLYGFRSEDARVKIPKAMDADFSDPRNDEERAIKACIDAFDRAQAMKFEQELFKQRKRLADAERTLQSRTTNKALNDQRIARSKVDWLLGKLGDIRRSEPEPRDSRIFPGHYAPVMIAEAGKRIVRPMRYQCRPAGMPASSDRKYPGTYNARRDNLEGFWKGQFGVSHGLIALNAFYENVSRQRLEGREPAADETEENVVLEFRPQPQQDMLVACLWSHWRGEGAADLLSFAAITDAPPAEIAAAGHDRCIIPIKPEHIDAWLNPDPANLSALYAILDDRERPFFEHRLAA